MNKNEGISAKETLFGLSGYELTRNKLRAKWKKGIVYINQVNTASAAGVCSILTGGGGVVTWKFHHFLYLA